MSTIRRASGHRQIQIQATIGALLPQRVFGVPCIIPGCPLRAVGSFKRGVFLVQVAPSCPECSPDGTSCIRLWPQPVFSFFNSRLISGGATKSCSDPANIASPINVVHFLFLQFMDAQTAFEMLSSPISPLSKVKRARFRCFLIFGLLRKIKLEKLIAVFPAVIFQAAACSGIGLKLKSNSLNLHTKSLYARWRWEIRPGHITSAPYKERNLFS